LIGGAVLVLVVAASVAIPFLIPVDRYRPLLEQYIRTGTGRDVRIGALRLVLWPRIHVHAADVRLRNPAGFPAGDAIEVKSVDLGVEPRALLARRLAITYVALSGVRMNVLSDAAGRTNYDLPAPPRAAPPAAAGGQPLLALTPIGAMTVKNVEVTIGGLDARRGQTAPVVTLAGLNARVRLIDPGASDWTKRLEITSDLRGARLVTPLLAAPVRFQSGEFHLRGGKGQGTFAAALETTRATGTVAIASVAPPAVTFTLAIPRLDANRLQRLMRTRGPAVPGQAGPRRLVASGEVGIDKLVFSPVEMDRIRSRLSIYTDAVRADSYRLDAYGGTVQGAAALNYASAGLPASGTARVRGLDLGQVVRLADPRAPKTAGAVDADLQLSTALGRNPLAALVAAGTFAVHRLAVPPVAVSQASGRLRVHGGRLELPAYMLSAFGGTVQGAAALDYAAAALPVAGTVRARAINVAQVVGLFNPGPPRITGALDTDLRFSTALGRDPQAALTGAGTFAVRNGTLPGLNLRGFMVTATRALQLGLPQGPTRFRYFGGDVRIAQQRVSSQALRLDGDDIEGTGRGNFGFDKTLDYTGTGVLKSLTSPGTSPVMGVVPSAGEILGRFVPGAAGATGVRIPFSIHGTFDDPKFALAGTPEFIRGTGPQPQQMPPQPQQPQVPQLPPALQDLLKPSP
jgi:AsmA protein